MAAACYGATLLMQVRYPAMPIERHVDPRAETVQLPYPDFFVALVLGAFDSLSWGNFSGAMQQIKSLGFAYIPEKFKFVFDRFTQIMNDEMRLLNDTSRMLDEAESLIDVGSEGEAKLLLERASRKLTLANETYRMLRAASDEIAGAFKLPRSDLFKGLDGISQFIHRLYQRLLHLLERAEKQRSLEETFLTVNVKPGRAWVGGIINVAGSLRSAQAALPERMLEILLDGAIWAETLTAEDGSFSITFNLPYIYKHTVAVQAKYTPTGADAEAYKPSISDAVEVSLLYIEPKVIVEPVGWVPPGKAFTVRGSVHSTSPLPYSSVKVSWVGSVLDVKLREDGRFEARLNTPGDIPDGKYTLRVNTPASGVFAPSAAALTVTVERIPVNVTLNVPGFALAGLGALLRGSFSSGDERLNATVKAYFAGQEYAVESNGDFAIRLSAPLTLLSGYQTFKVRVTPSDPWFSDAAYEGSILVVNPLTVLAPIGILIALAVKVLGRRASAAIESLAGVAAAEVKREETPGMAESYFVTEEFRWLMDLYWEAAVLVGEMTGVVLEPHMTMREFLSAAAPKLGKLYWCLETLTSAAERALYSPAVPAWATSTARMALNNLRAEYARLKP
jgi:RNAse (barnase) inhibitor barstar